MCVSRFKQVLTERNTRGVIPAAKLKVRKQPLPDSALSTPMRYALQVLHVVLSSGCCVCVSGSVRLCFPVLKCMS